MVVVKGFLEIKEQMVRVAEGKKRLAALGINRQAALICLDGGVHLLQFPMAVS